MDLAVGHYRSFDLDRDGVEKDQVEVDFQQKNLDNNQFEIGLIKIRMFVREHTALCGGKGEKGKKEGELKIKNKNR